MERWSPCPERWSPWAGRVVAIPGMVVAMRRKLLQEKHLEGLTDFWHPGRLTTSCPGRAGVRGGVQRLTDFWHPGRLTTGSEYGSADRRSSCGRGRALMKKSSPKPSSWPSTRRSSRCGRAGRCASGGPRAPERRGRVGFRRSELPRGSSGYPARWCQRCCGGALRVSSDGRASQHPAG